MNTISKSEIVNIISTRVPNKALNLSNIYLENMDLSSMDLRNIDFSGSHFKNVIFSNSNLDYSNISSSFFQDSPLDNTSLRNADISKSLMRYCNLRGADISGSNLFTSVLEFAILDDIIYDDHTKFFRLQCPETGAFIGWKCCTEFRVVQLLIPADALRTSATYLSCRCNKAKVLSIKSIDSQKSYNWAQSTVDENFYYTVGEWSVVENFNTYRWMDSTTGIHFFMERQQAVDYQIK